MLRFGAGLVEGVGEWKNCSSKEVCSGEEICRSERSCCCVCSSRSLGGKVVAWSCCGGAASARSSKVHCCVLCGKSRPVRFEISAVFSWEEAKVSLAACNWLNCWLD